MMLNAAILQKYPVAIPGVDFSVGRPVGVQSEIIEQWDSGKLGQKPKESEVLAAFDAPKYWRETKAAEVYSRAKQLLDAQSTGRSAVELSRWPLMQAEVVEYQSSGTVGPMMSAEISLGRHTADSLSALLAPKIAYEQSVMQSRTNHVLAIEAIADPETYDTATGWPE